MLLWHPVLCVLGSIAPHLCISLDDMHQASGIELVLDLFERVPPIFSA